MFAGLPGSGKSTLARELHKQLPNATLIQSDVIRKQMFPIPTYDGAESGSVFSLINSYIEKALCEDRDVIFDATNLREGNRKTVYKIAKRFNARVFLLLVVVPDDIAIERLKMRKSELKMRKSDKNMSDANEDIYRRMQKRGVSGTTKYPCFYLDGRDNPADNVEFIRGVTNV